MINEAMFSMNKESDGSEPRDMANRICIVELLRSQIARLLKRSACHLPIGDIDTHV
jgi:hypothetical protein